MNTKSILQNQIKAAYEESIHGNCARVKDILFDCIGLMAMLNPSPPSSDERNEIEKVKRRISIWFNAPNQNNSVILLNYLKLYDKQMEH